MLPQKFSAQSNHLRFSLNGERHLIASFWWKIPGLHEHSFRPLHGCMKIGRYTKRTISSAFVCKLLLPLPTIAHRWTHIEGLFKPTHSASATRTRILRCTRNKKILINNLPSLSSHRCFVGCSLSPGFPLEKNVCTYLVFRWSAKFPKRVLNAHSDLTLALPQLFRASPETNKV